MIQLLRKTVWRFLNKPNIVSSDTPAIPLLDIYSKELKIGTYTATCTLVFITAFFKVAKGGNPVSVNR